MTAHVSSAGSWGWIMKSRIPLHNFQARLHILEDMIYHHLTKSRCAAELVGEPDQSHSYPDSALA